MGKECTIRFCLLLILLVYNGNVVASAGATTGATTPATVQATTAPSGATTAAVTRTPAPTLASAPAPTQSPTGASQQTSTTESPETSTVEQGTTSLPQSSSPDAAVAETSVEPLNTTTNETESLTTSVHTNDATTVNPLSTEMFNTSEATSPEATSSEAATPSSTSISTTTTLPPSATKEATGNDTDNSNTSTTGNETTTAVTTKVTAPAENSTAMPPSSTVSKVNASSTVRPTTTGNASSDLTSPSPSTPTSTAHTPSMNSTAGSTAASTGSTVPTISSTGSSTPTNDSTSSTPTNASTSSTPTNASTSSAVSITTLKNSISTQTNSNTPTQPSTKNNPNVTIASTQAESSPSIPGSSNGNTSLTTSPATTANGGSTESTRHTTPDPCSSLQCLNNGTCSKDTNGTATCQCIPGFSGNNCSTNINECSSNPCENGGTCIDKVNNYTCTCVPGYDGRNCEIDINECSSNPCENGGTCIDKVNNYTCTCAPGYDGINCEIDINECSSNPCENGGTCNDKVNNYTCTCAPGYDGINCEIDINECSSNPCENGGTCIDKVNNYTCTCVPGYDGINCEIDIDDCNGVDCENGGTCQDHVNNYTCNCMPEWEGRQCDIDVDECDASSPTHTCHKNAICTNTEGSYNCTCKAGFTGDGRACNDINECSNETLCQNGATCFNTPGSFICYCSVYWTGRHCDEDVDECKSTSPCTVGANCTNTAGNYSCECNHGFRGDGYTKCYQETLIPMKGGSPVSGDDEVLGPVKLPEAVYYFGKPFNTFYVSMNGYVTLGNNLNQRYPPSNPSVWGEFQFPVISPLWSDIETSGSGSGVRYAVVTDSETLELIKIALKTSMSPSVSIIVTWMKAAPYPFEMNSPHETADFQAVISKVGSETFVMFNYDQELFTWKTGIDRLVTVGYSDNTSKGIINFGSNDFTEVTTNGSKGINGRWIFNVTSNKSGWVEESACLSKSSSLKLAIDSAKLELDACPCSISQIQIDRRFRLDLTVADVKQYASRFRRGSNNARQRCHYSLSGSLLQGYPDGGYIEVDSVEEVYTACCTDLRTCSIFYNINPSDTCRAYTPPSWAPSWGDPHITTLDGARYTFNARGEFILLQLLQPEVITVQVRTELAKENNTDATVFVGLAAQVGDAEKVELLLNRTNKVSHVYIDGILNSSTGSSIKELMLTDMEILFNDSAFAITFKAGITIQVTISDILDIVASVPHGGNFMGNTLGLLGNNNGNPDDDYRPRNDTKTPVPRNSAEADLYSKFGLTWKVEDSESLFSYNISGGSYEFYNNASISPENFLSDKVADLEAYLNKTCGYGAVNLAACGDNTQCKVDAAATCDVKFGESTKNTEEKAVNEKKQLDHMPPKFDLPNPLYVGFAENATEFNFDFSIDVQTSISSSFHNESYFSWNVTDELKNSSVYLRITGTDNESATSEYWPDIYYCGCSEKSECDYTLIVEDGPVKGSEGKFFRARCNCSEGRTGQFCDKKVDRCASCYDSSACNSSVPTSSNPCGACPPGLTGDGSRCYDVNECYEDTDLCSQICHNNNGSYSCSCEDGYRLATDGFSCEDIDECAMGSDACNATQYCVNTPGSYRCPCLPGLSLRPDEHKCVKENAAYGGVIVFETPQTDPADMEKSIRKYLKDIYDKGVVTVVFIEVTVHRFDAQSRRKRSTTDDTKWTAEFVLHLSSEEPTEKISKILHDSLNNDLASDGGYAALPDAPIRVSLDESKVYKDDDQGICKIPGKTDCDFLSTSCHSANGTFSCRCRAGYSGWENPYTSCKDVDECVSAVSVCDGGSCVNTPGSYICNCPAGFVYDGSRACTDMCTSSPCQNGGQCIHGDLQGQYLCKCDDKWTGAHCEDKNEEAEKLKIIAIAVGASVGAVCLLLMFAMFGMYRRHKMLYGGYRKSLSSDFDTTFRLTGSTIRTKDFPIDDDTDTPGFSIPRPKYNNSAYDSLGEHERDDASYRGLETGSGMRNMAYVDDHGTFF